MIQWILKVLSLASSYTKIDRHSPRARNRSKQQPKKRAAAREKLPHPLRERIISIDNGSPKLRLASHKWD